MHVYGRNLITEFTSAASPRVDISNTCKVGQKLGVSLPLLTCYPSGVTIPTTVPQRSEIPEGLMNYPVLLRHESRAVKQRTNSCRKFWLNKDCRNEVIFKFTNFKSHGFRYFEFDRFTPLRRKPSTWRQQVPSKRPNHLQNYAHNTPKDKNPWLGDCDNHRIHLEITRLTLWPWNWTVK